MTTFRQSSTATETRCRGQAVQNLWPSSGRSDRLSVPHQRRAGRRLGDHAHVGLHVHRDRGPRPRRRHLSEPIPQRYLAQYEHLYREEITDGLALAAELEPFKIIYNAIRPHQYLGDRTPASVHLADDEA
jgi:transposase InsO family protein